MEKSYSSPLDQSSESSELSNDSSDATLQSEESIVNGENEANDGLELMNSCLLNTTLSPIVERSREDGTQLKLTV